MGSILRNHIKVRTESASYYERRMDPGRRRKAQRGVGTEERLIDLTTGEGEGEEVPEGEEGDAQGVRAGHGDPFLLSLDPGSRNLGWAVLTRAGERVASSCPDAIGRDDQGKNKSYEHTDTMRNMHSIVGSIKRKHPLMTHSLVENIHVGQDKFSCFNQTAQGALMLSCAVHGLHVECISSTSAKAYCRRKGYPWPPKQPKGYNKRRALEIVRDMGYPVSNHNEADAILQGLAYLERLDEKERKQAGGKKKRKPTRRASTTGTKTRAGSKRAKAKSVGKRPIAPRRKTG